MSFPLAFELLSRATVVAVFTTCAGVLSAREPEGTGRILGRVSNAETGDPIPGVSVRVVGVEDGDRDRALDLVGSYEQMVDPFSIIGMEVYRPEETPDEFWSPDLCGAIVIWTEQGTPR